MHEGMKKLFGSISRRQYHWPRRSLEHRRTNQRIVVSVGRLLWLSLFLGIAGVITILCWVPRYTPETAFLHSTEPRSHNIRQPPQQPDPAATDEPVVDVVSTGSLLRPQYHEIQRKAFKQHPAVRHFYATTEKNDTESICHTDLVWNRIKDTLIFCRRRPTNHTYLDSHREFFGVLDKGNLARMYQQVERARGWLCAQKRPMDGFVGAMTAYRSGTTPLPDYLIFMDDDTWMDVSKVTDYLRHNFPSSRPYVITGCLIWMADQERAWSWAWGGYGIFFTRAAIQRLLTPIYCDAATEDDFVSHACRRLEEDQIGEKSAFHPGMSVADLMERYTFRHRYQDVKNWTDVGFCLHSDHIWTYFANYYFISLTNPQVTHPDAPEDRIYPYDGSRVHPMKWLKHPDRESGQCLHRDDDEACTAESHICHRISERRMAELWHIPLPDGD